MQRPEGEVPSSSTKSPGQVWFVICRPRFSKDKVFCDVDHVALAVLSLLCAKSVLPTRNKHGAPPLTSSVMLYDDLQAWRHTRLRAAEGFSTIHKVLHFRVHSVVAAAKGRLSATQPLTKCARCFLLTDGGNRTAVARCGGLLVILPPLCSVVLLFAKAPFVCFLCYSSHKSRHSPLCSTRTLLGLLCYGLWYSPLPCTAR